MARLIDHRSATSFRRRCIAIAAAVLVSGAAAGTLTVNAMARQGSPVSVPPPPEDRSATASEQGSLSAAQLGTSWAAQAFPVGLRRCPDADPAFVAACQAQMTALASASGQGWQTAVAVAAESRRADPEAERSSDDDAQVRVWRASEEEQGVGAPETARAVPQYACYGCDRDEPAAAIKAAPVVADRPENMAAQPAAAAWQRMAGLNPGPQTRPDDAQSSVSSPRYLSSR